LWFREENFILVGPTFITLRIDAISPTADPSVDDGVSSLSVRNGLLDGFVIDEHLGMGFSGTCHDLTSWHPEVAWRERLVYTSGSDSARVCPMPRNPECVSRSTTVGSLSSIWSGRREQLLFNYMGWELRKPPAAGEVFFLTSPFIELIRS
jgi:hypothetical protein